MNFSVLGMCTNMRGGNIMDLKDYLVFKTHKNYNDIGRMGDDSWNTIDRVSIELSGKYALRDIYPTDYAVAIGAMLAPKYGKFGRKKGWAWLRNAHSNVTEKRSNLLDGRFEDAVDHYHGCIVPAFSLDLDKVRENLSSDGKDFRFVEKNVLGDKFMGLEFGWYPKTYVGDDKNEKLESEFANGHMRVTGKEYMTGLDDNGKPEYCKEYEADNARYVRVEAFSPDFDSEFASGEFFGDYEPKWFAVEPITWMVKNWKELPKSINPKGNGKADTIDVVAHEGIIAGIPFYPNTFDGNRGLWQNSMVRGYLNGINVSNIKSGGNIEFGAPNGGDYRLHSFLSEAFEPAKQKQNAMPTQPSVASTIQKMTEENKEKKMDLKKRRGYGVEIEETPMSIDDQLKFYIDNKMSFMLHGPSGVGKTRRIEEIDPDFVSIVLRNGMLPEEIIGKNIYPNMENIDAGKWVPPSWYTDLWNKCEQEPDTNHVLFIDELTNANEHVQSLVYHLVLNNSIGPNYGKLPDNAVVVAAGNSMEESSSAYNMPEPLFRRFAGHVYLPLDIPSWLEWGSKKIKDGDEEHVRIHPLVSNFVATYGEKVFHSTYNQDEPPKYETSPRGWEQVSKIIYSSNGKLSQELIENKLGPELANNFIAFARKTPLFVEDIVEGNYSSDDIPTQFDERYAMVLSFRYASKSDMPVIRKFVAKYFGGEMLNIFEKAWVNDEAEKAIYLNMIKKQAQNEPTEVGEPVDKKQPKKKSKKSPVDENDHTDYSDLLVDLTDEEIDELREVCKSVLDDHMENKLPNISAGLWFRLNGGNWSSLFEKMKERGVFENNNTALNFISDVGFEFNDRTIRAQNKGRGI